MMNKMTPLTIANTLDQSNKQRVEVDSQQTIKQGVRTQNLGPKGNFDVYDQFGKVISNQQAGQFRDATVYVGVGKIAGGAGIKMKDFKNLQAIDFPSMTFVNQHSSDKSVGAFVVKLPGVVSHQNRAQQMYNVMVDIRDFPHSTPQSYVLEPKDSEILHCNVYEAKKYSLAPKLDICAICHGVTSQTWSSYRQTSSDQRALLGSYLDQVLNVLANPNLNDAARSVNV